MKGSVSIRCTVSHRGTRRRAFTLIEILIVITVIGILAALMFPVFSRVKQSAYTTTCASNLHQLSVAIEMYANDNSDYYPSPIPPPLNPYRCTWVNRIESYFRSPQVMQCPAYPHGDFVSGCPASEVIDGKPVEHHGSYSLLRLNQNPGQFNNVRIRSVTHPSSTMLLLDGKSETVAFPTYPNPTVADLIDKGIVPRHRGDGINVLFADGHTKWRRMDSLLDKNLWLPYGDG